MGSGATRQRTLTGGNALDDVVGTCVMRDCLTFWQRIVIFPWIVGGIRQESARRMCGNAAERSDSKKYKKAFFCDPFWAGQIQFRTGVGTELHA